MDVTKLSVDELKKLAAGNSVEAPTTTEVDVSSLSPDQLKSLAGGESVSTEKSKASGLIGAVQWVGEKYDSYMGAPVRAGIGSMQDGQGFTKGYARQFGGDPKNAPTGQRIAQKAGVSDETAIDPNVVSQKNVQIAGGWSDPMAAGITALLGNTPKSQLAGFAIEGAADPVNLIPAVGPAIKAGGKVLGFTGKVGGTVAKGIGKAGVAAIDMASPSAAAAVEGTAEGFKNAAQTLARTVNPKVRPEFEMAAKIAMKNGVNPDILTSSIKYGPNSFISKAERVRAQGPLGEQMMIKHQDGLNKLRAATDGVIERIGGGLPPLDPTDAGELLREGYNQSVSKFFDNMDVTYKSAQQQIPNISVTPKSQQILVRGPDGKGGLDAVFRKATLTLQNYPKGSGRYVQAQRVVDEVNKLQQVAAKRDYGQLVDKLNYLGEQGFKHTRGVSSADIPPDVQAYRDMYSATRDALLHSVDQHGGKNIGKALRENNKAMTDFFGENRLVSDILSDRDMGGEKVFQKLIQNPDSRKIRAMKNILAESPEALARMKASFVESLKTIDKDGGFSFAGLGTSLRNNPKAAVIARELFEPEELQALTELVKVGEDYGPPILNNSGTDISAAFRDIPKEVGAEGFRGGLLEFMKRRADYGSKVVPQVPGELLPTMSGATPQSAIAAPSTQQGSRGLGALIAPLKASQIQSIERGGPVRRPLNDDRKKQGAK